MIYYVLASNNNLKLVIEKDIMPPFPKCLVIHKLLKQQELDIIDFQSRFLFHLPPNTLDQTLPRLKLPARRMPKTQGGRLSALDQQDALALVEDDRADADGWEGRRGHRIDAWVLM